MQGNINMDLLFCTSDQGIPFDERGVRLSTLFYNQGLSKIVEVIAELIQEVLIARLLKDGQAPLTCCSGSHLHLHDRRKRQIRCSFGPVQLNIWRVKCSQCGKKHQLLSRYLQLEKDQTKSHELE